MSKLIHLGRGTKVAVVDDGDYKLASRYAWKCTRGSAKRSLKPYDLGRYLLRLPPGVQVKHINGDPLDYRRENLKPIDYIQPEVNMVPDSEVIHGTQEQGRRTTEGCQGRVSCHDSRSREQPHDEPC